MAYTTSDEQLQIEEIKQWWKENGKVIIAAVILAIVGVFGWRYWQGYQQEKIHQSSAEFSQIMAATEQSDTGKANAQLTQFVEANPSSTYSAFLLLEQAKKQIDVNQWQQAADTLQKALNNAKDAALISLIALRLASVQTQLKQFEPALATLGKVTDQAWQGRKAMLSGEIYNAMGNKAEAKKSFEAALTTANPLEAQWLQIQINNL
ncbi:YfgM family protein [Gallibacterium anatis]|uniref:YfgM family protein n=1 Tax=Gallibacterium anatis TaxID=750 RepID=UPI00254CEE2A|nr:tetratricopeptide repeat protein [Gallibacterium anatis]MDK9560016.1 tetratricopeptide repeat protein [Gallibacterium anatis]